MEGNIYGGDRRKQAQEHTVNERENEVRKDQDHIIQEPKKKGKKVCNTDFLRQYR
jgi:hypothetical protein